MTAPDGAPPPGYRLADLTWPEVEERLAHATLVILPLGATEQHGPGLALRADTTRAELVADEVAARLEGRALVAPTIPVGISDHHMAFPGSLTLSVPTLMAVIRDVVTSLHRHGVRRVFVLTGHGGNGSAVDVALTGLRRELPDMLLAWSGLTPIAADVARELSDSAVGGHASEIEVSQSWFLDPTLVRPAGLARGSSRLDDLDAAGVLSRRNPAVHFQLRYDALSATGALGDPREATPEKGRRLIAAIVDRLVAFLDDFSRLDPFPTHSHIQRGVPDEA